MHGRVQLHYTSEVVVLVPDGILLKKKKEKKMRTASLVSAVLLVGLVVTAPVDADVKSGLQAGASATPFNVKDCTGEKKGSKLCYR